MKRPAQVYTPSQRKFEGTPEDLNYPKMDTRRVQETGHIRHGKDSVFISSALAGWSVGLEACAAEKFNVHFARLLLGQYDKSTASFERIEDAVRKKEDA
jgi:putative transposase